MANNCEHTVILPYKLTKQEIATGEGTIECLKCNEKAIFKLPIEKREEELAK